ncbi:MAG: hypothetical protein M1833_000817 [Piccolia ochrophora]|nr:MAG: hypothetical protein M1833_000817 [Piccolia ochrophora]
MSQPKIFATGATGYIGGDALHAIFAAHPDSDVTCLVRNSSKGAQVASKHPSVKLVYGDLSSSDLVRAEAQKADIVLNFADADHADGASAISEGLAAREASTPAFLIHTSGTGVLTFADIERKTFGETSTKIYNDWDGVHEVTSLPDFAPHRNVDKIVLAAASDKVKTAIVCPPLIYGEGRGAGNTRSIQLPEISRATLERRRGFMVGEGKSYWTNIHVADLSQVYLRLLEEAIQGGGKATWGAEGYYFTEHGDVIWGDISRAVAAAAHKEGLIESDDVASISGDEAMKLTDGGAVLWGSNSRGRALRAQKLLGWEAKEKSLMDEVPNAVHLEAQRLGLIKGHAAQVSS